MTTQHSVNQSTKPVC